MTNNMEQRLKSLHEKFTEKYIPVTESGCWLWTAAINAYGYGVLNHKNKIIFAHRHSYEYFTGKIPDGLIVRHLCNMPSCVNPYHLAVGTPQDNANDRIGSDTNTYGEKNARAKLKESDVLIIRKMLSDGIKQSDIASLFNVSNGTICDIKKKRSWYYLDKPSCRQYG